MVSRPAETGIKYEAIVISLCAVAVIYFIAVVCCWRCRANKRKRKKLIELRQIRSLATSRSERTANEKESEDSSSSSGWRAWKDRKKRMRLLERRRKDEGGSQLTGVPVAGCRETNNIEEEQSLNQRRTKRSDEMFSEREIELDGE